MLFLRTPPFLVLQEVQGMVRQSGVSGLDEVDLLIKEALVGGEIISLESRPGRERFTTKEMRQIEREMLEKARILHGEGMIIGSFG